MLITQMKGNLVKEPSWNSSKTIFELRIAVDKAVKYKTEDNTFAQKTGYFNVKFFKDRAIQVADMKLNAGDLVNITGDDQIVEYKTVNEPDVVKFDREILGRSIEVISKKAANKSQSNVRLKQNSVDQLSLESDITKEWTIG